MMDEMTEDQKNRFLGGVVMFVVMLGMMAFIIFSDRRPSPQQAQATTTTVEEAKRKDGNATVRSFRYLYDSSTKLCFVYMWKDNTHGNGSSFDMGGPALTWVPCSPEVMARVVNKPAETPTVSTPAASTESNK